MIETTKTDSKVTLSKTQIQKAVSVLDDLQDHAHFIKEMVLAGNLRQDDRDTYMSLYRAHYDDLADIFGKDALSKDLELAQSMCRDANERLAAMEKESAETVRTHAARARMCLMEDWFQAWYSMSGFHYARTEWTEHSLHANFSYEINPLDACLTDTYGNVTDFIAKVAHAVPYAFSKGWDLYDDSLIDTENNHKKLKALFTGAFPDARILSFSSRPDKEAYVLRFEASIPWESIEAWHDATVEKAETNPSWQCGAWYARRLELRRRVNKSAYRKYRSASEIEADEKELARIETVTELWTCIIRMMLSDGAACCRNGVSLRWDGGHGLRAKDFAPGTKYEDIVAWVENEFQCSAAKDLAGREGMPYDTSCANQEP